MEKLKRNHRLDSGMRGWIITTARKNLWRVPIYYDLDDLIQEGFLCYAICYQRYKDINQAHFMALVKRSYINHLHDLAKERSRYQEVVLPPDNQILSGVDYNEGPFRILLQQLPDQVNRLLDILGSTARNIPSMIRDDRTKETTNEYLCRLIGLDPKLINLQTIFIEHFS